MNPPPPSSLAGPGVQPALRDEILKGLSRPRKKIASKYFYDERGAWLFEQICELEEYYLARVELEIVEQYAEEMTERLGPRCLLIEYGSGNSRKTRQLLELLRAPAAYVPIDLSAEQLRHTASGLLALYPGLAVLPLCRDFTQPFELPRCPNRVARRAVYFPGSTIGNFGPAAARRLLRGTVELCGPGGGLLIGVDLKKDPERLQPAYSDSQGVTRQFNLNLLRRLNRELNADFDLEQFRHLAFYNPRFGRMESHLVSLTKQTVTVAGAPIHFQQGESIHTENSYKYHLDEFRALAASAGLRTRRVWTDQEALFSVQYLEVPLETHLV